MNDYFLQAKRQCVFSAAPNMALGIVNLLSDLYSSRPVCDTRHMNTPSTNCYKHHRFSAEIISHGVWLYFRFCPSYRDVEELLLTRNKPRPTRPNEWWGIDMTKVMVEGFV
jgi:hypothetical protein